MPPQAGNSRTLPKFGEWDVKNPESGEGFTVIFNKARDQKKTSGLAVGTNGLPGQKHNHTYEHKKETKKDKKPKKQSKKFLCCFYTS